MPTAARTWRVMVSYYMDIPVKLLPHSWKKRQSDLKLVYYSCYLRQALTFEPILTRNSRYNMAWAEIMEILLS